MQKLRLAILLSGRGSNFRAINEAILSQKLDAEIVVVLSDQAQAGGLAYAREEKIPHHAVIRKSGESRLAYDLRLVEILENESIDIIALAGYMRILTPDFLKSFEKRVVNIHPSLLPAFPGLYAQRQALAAGVRFSGCTVHFVDEGCDTGPIIDQRVVPVLPEDDEQALSLRILREEHQLYSVCLQKIAEKKVRIAGKKVIID